MLSLFLLLLSVEKGRTWEKKGGEGKKKEEVAKKKSELDFLIKGVEGKKRKDSFLRGKKKV